MKIRAAILIAASTLALNACGKDNSPTQPTQPTQSQAKFTATMLPANEVPAVTNAEASGSGTMNITFNLTKDAAGNITDVTVDFAGSVTGFPAGMSLTAAHIHPGAAGTTGGVLLGTGITAGEVTFANGSGPITKSVGSGNLKPSDAAAIIANPAAYYFNIHTALNPGGVARGQLVRVQ